jgi:competence protein ComEA
MVSVALAMTLLLFVKGRQTGVNSGLTTLSVAPKQTSVLQISGDVKHPGIYEISDNIMTVGVIEMAKPFCDVLPALSTHQLSTGKYTVNSMKIVCKDIQNKPVIRMGRINPRECLTLGVPLDINMMTEADFVLLPGVGPVLARRIVLARQLNGGFASINDLLLVEGISEKKLNQLTTYFKIPIQQKK